jgi:glutamine synthetase adenylyltransferase
MFDDNTLDELDAAFNTYHSHLEHEEEDYEEEEINTEGMTQTDVGDIIRNLFNDCDFDKQNQVSKKLRKLHNVTEFVYREPYKEVLRSIIPKLNTKMLNPKVSNV